MAKHERQFLKDIHFTGGRFEETEGWLDLDVLNELLIYRTILIATIRETWLLEHPGRERLPRGFAQDFRLGISDIGAGSCSVRLEFIVPEMRVHQTERLFDAARIVDETLIAAQDTDPFPMDISDSVRRMYAKWGKTLRWDESIILSECDGRNPIYNAVIRQNIMAGTSEVMTVPPIMKPREITDGSTAVSILEMFAEIHRSNPEPEGYVPPPSDLAKNYKHYLYGFPKEE